MPFFKNVFRSKEGSRSTSKTGYHDQDGAENAPPPKPRWENSWTRKEVAPEQVHELIHICTQEMKTRALDTPFMLLPFRLTSDTSASRNFIRNFFKADYEGTHHYQGEGLAQELRLAEPMTLCSIIKWCWSRLPGGVVTWDAYELFRIGESDSNVARHAFDTFIPISVDSDARKRIIFDFFDLLAAVAARGKSNGMGGRKLSRLAGWWAFEFIEDGKGFEGGYRTWEKAADAASHLFFAYLRSLSPDANVVSGISTLPRSLQALLSQTEYPPQAPSLMQSRTTKVVMIVDSVSPTPFSLLRRARHFEYRDDDSALQKFSSYDDAVSALTDECRRVLECIASANQSVVASETKLMDPSWSRFEDFGFTGILDGTSSTANGTNSGGASNDFRTINSRARSRVTDHGRPTTPSWADFLSSGFADEGNQTSPPTLMMPTQKLPPIGQADRVHSSQSHVRNGVEEEDLEPGELASITQFDLDETFWWVWMISLASEETPDRKAAFGRCALIETRISGAKWLVMEEQVKGASAGPEEGAYIAEKKPKFSFTRRGRLGRRKSTGKKPTLGQKDPYEFASSISPMSKTSIGPDQHARIQAAAAKLALREREQKESEQLAQRRARLDDTTSVKTNSVLTLQPHLLSAAGPAMKWDKKFGEAALDKDALRAQYLGDPRSGKGSKENLLTTANSPRLPLSPELADRDLPALPTEAGGSNSKRAISPSPVRLGTNTRPSAEASVTKVPWPNDSPINSPKVPAQEEFFSPTTETVGQHPALRKAVPGRKPVNSPPAPMPAPVSVPARADEDQNRASEKAQSNKPKKKEGGGLRKLFGRKRADTTKVSASTPLPIDPIHSKDYDDDAPIRSIHPDRSTSRLGDNDRPTREPSPAYSTENSTPFREPSPRFERSAVPVSPAMAESSALSPSMAQPTPQHQPPRFNHGPIDDMPAFVPDDSDDEADQALSVPRRDLSKYSAESSPITPTQHISQHGDDVSEESVDLNKQASAPNQDRWAQIRKNAADRAARLSEEQTHRSRSQSQSQRTDEGETSGEETIENRVARIKARVAELTGNPDGQPATGAAGRSY